MSKSDISESARIELESRAFRRLVEHLRSRPDVQNIDLMNLSGFCRNCLSRWYMEAASDLGIELSKDESREIIYGMPFSEWKEKHQTEASKESQEAFNASHSDV